MNSITLSSPSASLAISQVSLELNVPVLAVVKLCHLIAFAQTPEGQKLDSQIDLAVIERYRAEYGVEY